MICEEFAGIMREYAFAFSQSAGERSMQKSRSNLLLFLLRLILSHTVTSHYHCKTENSLNL